MRIKAAAQGTMRMREHENTLGPEYAGKRGSWMTSNAHLLVTEAGKPIASGRRRFLAYGLHGLGAVIGACVTIFTLSVVPAGITDASSLDEYGRTVSLGWLAFWQFLIVVPAAAVGASIATLGLPILRGHRRSPAASVLIGVAGMGLVVSGAASLVVQAERGFL
jgi:hypothetical protein